MAVVPALGPPGDVGLVGRQRRLGEVVAPVHTESRTRDLDPGVDMLIKSLQRVGRHLRQDEAEVGDPSSMLRTCVSTC